MQKFELNEVQRSDKHSNCSMKYEGGEKGSSEGLGDMYSCDVGIVLLMKC